MPERTIFLVVAGRFSRVATCCCTEASCCFTATRSFTWEVSPATFWFMPKKKTVSRITARMDTNRATRPMSRLVVAAISCAFCPLSWPAWGRPSVYTLSFASMAPSLGQARRPIHVQR